jgi:hypothetical protein
MFSIKCPGPSDVVSRPWSWSRDRLKTEIMRSWSRSRMYRSWSWSRSLASGLGQLPLVLTLVGSSLHVEYLLNVVADICRFYPTGKVLLCPSDFCTGWPFGSIGCGYVPRPYLSMYMSVCLLCPRASLSSIGLINVDAFGKTRFT